MKTQAAPQKKLELAIKAGQKRNYRKAASILEELISCSDAPAEAWLLLGRALHALGEYSRALVILNDFIRLRPKSSQGYLFAGRSCLNLNIPRQAAGFFRKARSLNPESVIITALLGIAYLKSRHSQLASDTLQIAVEKAAEKGLPAKTQQRIYHAYINALFIRAMRLCRLGEFDLGRQMLAFVLENGADSPLLRLELGRACRELGLLPEALEHYSRALEYNPKDTRIRWYRCSILMSLGNQEEALKDIEEIRAVDSSLPDLSWNSRLVDLFMIRSFLEKGEWRRAADCCRNWLKQYGHDPLIHAMHAEALRNLRDFTSALNHLDRAAELEPKNLDLWYERILVSWEGENWPALQKSLRVARNLSGDKELIRRFSILLEAKTLEDDKKTIALLQNAVRDIGPDPELMYALGERYLKTGLADLALVWFRKTISVFDRHERSWLGRIAALEALAVEDYIAEAEKAGKKTGLLSSAERRKARMKTAANIAGELRESYDGYCKRWSDNFALRRERAIYLMHTFAYEEAVKELEALLARESGNFSLRRVLAYGYRKTGRYREAAVFLKSLLKQKGRDTGLIIEYSGCLERSGAGEYAAAVLEKALELSKKDVSLHLALALLYFKDRRIEKAFDLLRGAAALDKKDPRPYRLMAAMSLKTGSREEAKKFEYEAGRREKKK